MPATATPKKNRVRIAQPSGPTKSRDIFVDGVLIGRCFKTAGLRSEPGCWVVRDLDNKPLTKTTLYAIADVRAYFDPTPV